MTGFVYSVGNISILTASIADPIDHLLIMGREGHAYATGTVMLHFVLGFGTLQPGFETE